MARKQHSHHYIYKTTCKVSGRFYIGMHSTSNLEDGYIGSGKRLWLSIRKHGIENHEIEILEYFPNRSSLKLRERELVNESLLLDPMCMNLQLGGGGGFINEEHKSKFHSGGGKKGGAVHRDRLLIDKEYREVHLKQFLNFTKSKIVYGTTFLGKKHTEETKQKMRGKDSQKLEKNSQYGSCWITNGIENRKMKNDDVIPEGWKRGRKT